ncbi:MAG: hypothetical protein AB4038_09520 [Prochloraceae cyanobacterium]
MKPKFKNTLAWEQAQILMQPAFIRVIDNLRKQLEESSWQGNYQEIKTPLPGYQLCLTRQDRSIEIDIWDLCFQVCFRDYSPTQVDITDEQITASREVEIDTSLIDDETGDVDWHRLETKTQQLVRQVFASLPVE